MARTWGGGKRDGGGGKRRGARVGCTNVAPESCAEVGRDRDDGRAIRWGQRTSLWISRPLRLARSCARARAVRAIVSACKRHAGARARSTIVIKGDANWWQSEVRPKARARAASRDFARFCPLHPLSSSSRIPDTRARARVFGASPAERFQISRTLDINGRRNYYGHNNRHCRGAHVRTVTRTPRYRCEEVDCGGRP